MTLRQHHTPHYGSYVDQLFNNDAHQSFQQKSKSFHQQHQTKPKPAQTFDEIKAGAHYTILKLAKASYTTVLTQMFASKAYKEMEEPAIEAMYAEYAQLNDQKVYKLTDLDALTKHLTPLT